MSKRKNFNTRRACLRKAPRDHTHIGLCVMYCGTAFRGLQLQAHAPTHHTVEGVLIQALKDAGIVDGVQRGRVSGEEHHFARSCRTDRGVHAVRNLVCLFVPNSKLEAAGGCDRLPQLLNAHLPSTVRVERVTTVMGDFIPRFCCVSRIYRYMIPVYALLSPCSSWNEFYAEFPQAVETLRCRAQGGSFIDLCPNEEDKLLAALRDVVSRGNGLLAHHVVGTHRFHNFSASPGERYGHGWNRKVVMPNDNTSVRTVMRCEIAPRLFLFPQETIGPTRSEYAKSLKIFEGDTAAEGERVVAVSERTFPETALLPYLLFQIEGRSFLFNMIRKIVGLIIAVLRGARESLMQETLSAERHALCPLAPGSFLYLFHSFYTSYDNRVRRSGSTRFCPLEDEWTGEVGEAASAFAVTSIAADVIDLDMNRVPALGTLLSAIDAQRRVTRPCWEEEDAHLTSMKEFHPAVVEPHPSCSEMTTFLRSLRVHNWGLSQVKQPVQCGKNKPLDTDNGKESITGCEGVKQQRASGDGCVVDEGQVRKRARKEECMCEGCDGTPFSRETHTLGEEEVDDGWLYVASTLEEEQRLRHEHHKRVRRSRAWDGTAHGGGVEVAFHSDGDGGGSE
ncbi:pseudouridylate synthase I, putative [Trypanosoma brucei brucei TREU927]|uniref:Pseudouridylate synthase I, putative n=1 Tax=Trypanosoma brucei brucei (strain 927/4 GUTat10.1) TaxID=185431 RepID=Q57WP9_TRYB2|nr:pseudouridylate synthase I, putative [Trypanosoma brucei brucei TREU927]AAX69943.1 pseudouridylate synthase I, putative [Trypanosoma brucei]AAZ12216.1 pseudouridylate synthase I, putative [Trypanosoma brucei brucei TREU927]